MESKNILVSWTFWFGAAQILLGIIGFLSGMMGQVESGSLIVTGVTAIGLRVKTTQPVTVTQ